VVIAAAAAVVAIAGMLTWLSLPVEGVPIVVAPVVNQTGYAELEPYRLALTQELVTELSDSSVVRVFPYDRLLQIIRRFRVAGDDVSSRDALQAISGSTHAQQIIVPTLLYENGSWRARLEFRQPTTAINDATIETASVTSSLVKDTAYGLVPALAEAVNAHFLNTSYRGGGRRGHVVSRSNPPRLHTIWHRLMPPRSSSAGSTRTSDWSMRRLSASSQTPREPIQRIQWRQRGGAGPRG
jgi:hypothetical protein